MKKLTFCKAMLVAATLSGSVWAEQEKSEPQLRLEVNLVDGSRVVGIPSVVELKFVSSLGKINVPLKSVAKVVFNANKETATVSMTNGDCLSGVVDLASLDIEASWGKVGIAMQLVRTLTVRSNGCKLWNVRDDFSTSFNPNGLWSYGWVDEPGGKFSLCRMKFAVNQLAGWNASGETPGVWINQSKVPALGVSPGAVSLHPGPQGEHGVVRWTSPVKGVVHLQGTFGVGDQGTEDVRVYHNGQGLFQVLRATRDENFSLSVDVAIGDTVDFLVGGQHWAGNTPLDVTISTQ
jgi:hypothetical protein